MQAQSPPASYGVFRQWLWVVFIALSSSRLVITVPFYVLIGAVTLIPIGATFFLALPTNPKSSIFDGFLGDFLSAAPGTVPTLVNYFYFYLYLMIYLSIASVIGYEERRDRSIMFWKSLPISDAVWIAGQITALFMAFVIGIGVLVAFNTVITVWDYVYRLGLNVPDASFTGSMAVMFTDLAVFAGKALVILMLSLPFGVSMLWFANFCRRQPGGIWLATFVSIYLLCFLVRYIGFDVTEPLLWYPEIFVRISYWLLVYGRLPPLEYSVVWVFVASYAATAVFCWLTWRARCRSMPVS